MKVKCKYNDPNKVPNGIPQNSNYGLELNKEYFVMGIYRDGHQLFYFYLLVLPYSITKNQLYQVRFENHQNH